MSAKDIFHETVKKALQKDGWVITHDPMRIRTKGIQVYIDLGAEQIIAAEKEGQKIAVEVKSFMGPSAISEFHTALGQFLNYRQALTEQEPLRVLYLAVPLDTYDSFFKILFIQETVSLHKIKLIIYDSDNEVIIKWKN